MEKTPHWIADGGHSWLRVPLASCAGLPISPYSYRHGGYAYLEEDCDAELWLAKESLESRKGAPFIGVTFIDGDWVGRTRYERFEQTKEV